MQQVAYLYQTEAPVFFLVAVCGEPSQSWLHVHMNYTGLWRPLPTRVCGCGQFRTGILVHLRFKHIVSCWFSNRRMRLKIHVYGIINVEHCSTFFIPRTHHKACTVLLHSFSLLRKLVTSQSNSIQHKLLVIILNSFLFSYFVGCLLVLYNVITYMCMYRP